MESRNRGSELLNGPAAHTCINRRLEEMRADDVCAVFMADLDDMSEIAENAGKDRAEQARWQAGQVISGLFYASDIVGKIGEDEYLVFAVWQSGKDEFEEKAAQLCRSLCFDAGSPEQPVKVTACVGAYLAKGEDLTFDSVFGQAAAALYAAKNNGRGEYCVLTGETEDKQKESLSKPVNAVPMNTLLEYLDVGVNLLEIGTEIRLIYASRGFYRMARVEDDAYRLPCALKEMGIQSDCLEEYEAFLRDSVEKEGISDHVHRLSVNGTDWIWRHVRVARVAYPASKYPVVLEISTDVSNLMATERKLLETSDRLRIAFRQTPHLLWEVDISARTYNIYNVNDQQCDPETVIHDFPRSFEERGLVHPDSAEAFRRFAGAMFDGKSGDTGNFVLRDPTGNWYSWVSMSYMMMYDRNGAPVKAIGIQSKLPDVSGIGPDTFPRRPLPEVLRHQLILRLKVNVSADYVEEFWNEGMDQTAWTWGRTYSEIIRLESGRLFNESEKQEFRKRFDRESLLTAYKKGEYWSSGEYRRIDRGGLIRWVADAVNLTRDERTGSVYMFACFVGCQQRREWESRIDEGIFRDPQTRLYDYVTAKRLTEYLIESGRASGCALSLIRLVGASDADSPKDMEALKNIRRFLAVAMPMALGTDCIVGHYKDDMLYVFLPDAGNRYDIKRRIEDAFAYIRISMHGIPWLDRLRFVAGTVTEPDGDISMESMLLRAGYLCERWKDSAMDAVVFPSDDEDWAWMGLRSEYPGQEIPVEDDETDRPLTREEQRVAFRCVTDMLKAGTLESSLMNALRCIGGYYRAARVYIMVLSDDRQTVTMQNEWTEWGRQSIRYVMSGIQLSQIPLLLRCMEEGKTVCMESTSLTASRMQENGKWRFMACPMKKKEDVTGFLCVENAHEHESETALLNTLIPYIMGEQKRFDILDERRRTSGYDALTMLPNLSSYMDVIYSMDSDLYSSMGALSLDIPDFSMLNSTLGFEYGRKLLIYVSDTLINVFRNAYIFRTWDAEFVVLYPNTIQEVFNGRCARLRTMIQRRYPRHIRIGSVWSDGIFTARNLVREAQSVMRSEDVKEHVQENVRIMDALNEAREKTGFNRQRFVPYFQPKVDMRDGSLAGAEALARGIDSKGNIITPAQFIESLENDGSIRDLDLFMLDSVLRQLSEWQMKGLPLIKVSINISRVTLFNPTILASVLAIQSRYPNIPPDQIELEITETGGDMEKATLACIVDNFRECGLKFELDDFGTGYANMTVFSNIKFETIKLDRTLVGDLPGNEISSVLVENITKICENFGMQCIAEGVETRQQEEALLSAGCIYGQGFYYAKPLPSDEFEQRYLSGAYAAGQAK